MPDESLETRTAPAGEPTGPSRGRNAATKSIAHWPGIEPEPFPVEGRLPAFDGATGWINTEPLSPHSLRGRVVLVDFWTYTCVNWIRTLPYLRAWASKYEAAGLTVLGVHTPEFGFEGDIDRVSAQARKLGVHYPILLDSGYRVWSAFSNRFWPAVYLVDGRGRIRHHHFGEGEYAQTEMAIQRLLFEQGAGELDQDLVLVDPQGLELAADWESVRSPETYLGAAQRSGFASEGTTPLDLPYQFRGDPGLVLNSWDLNGNWTITPEAAGANAPGARIAFRFHARDVNLIMGPRVAGASVPFRVTLDRREVGDAAGTDVDPTGAGLVREHETHQLVRQRGRIVDRTVEIEFPEAGVAAYCFTFG